MSEERAKREDRREREKREREKRERVYLPAAAAAVAETFAALKVGG